MDRSLDLSAGGKNTPVTKKTLNLQNLKALTIVFE